MSIEVSLDDVNDILKKRGLEARGRVQQHIDSEVLRRSEPYTPLRTGQLRDSGNFGTQVGSGEVKWTAIYAKAQYYSKRSPGSATGALRGPQWFERMKNAHGKDIIGSAAKMAGGHK